VSQLRAGSAALGILPSPWANYARSRNIPVSETPDSGQRPAELDDRDWLRSRYERDGDLAIAIDLTRRYKRAISRGAVRRARERLGIPSAPPGRRCIVTSEKPRTDRTAAQRILGRLIRDVRDGTPPTYGTLMKRFVELDRARKARNPSAEQAALEALAAAAGLILDQQLRAA
jgi:hypothetical protein